MNGVTVSEILDILVSIKIHTHKDVVTYFFLSYRKLPMTATQLLDCLITMYVTH